MPCYSGCSSKWNLDCSGSIKTGRTSFCRSKPNWQGERPKLNGPHINNKRINRARKLVEWETQARSETLSSKSSLFHWKYILQQTSLNSNQFAKLPLDTVPNASIILGYSHKKQYSSPRLYATQFRCIKENLISIFYALFIRYKTFYWLIQ